MAGGAVAGGLFGIPLGAVAGYFVGDQIASRSQSRLDEQETELERLRRENERLRQEDRPAATSQLQQR